jgi:hypothetical protein
MPHDRATLDRFLRDDDCDGDDHGSIVYMDFSRSAPECRKLRSATALPVRPLPDGMAGGSQNKSRRLPSLWETQCASL